MSELLLGGRFVLGRELGSGGMARVFLGRDEVLDRPVAVKVLNPDLGGTELGARFEREGRTAARLSHPSIVQVYDAGEGEIEGRTAFYIVMEYVAGGDLKELVDGKGPLEGGKLAKLSAEISGGLAHAHERGVIHRDIKPANILIDPHGWPKLTDFGIARALDAAQETQTGLYLGTAIYSSPEQLRGERVTPKSDVYSFGCTLYYAATGQAPFAGLPVEVVGQHLSADPTPPRGLGAPVGVALEAFILDCLAKEPEDRPDAADMQAELLQMVAATTVASGAPEPATEPAAPVRPLETTVQSFGAAGAAGASRATKAAGAVAASGVGAAARWLSRLTSRETPRTSPGATVTTRTYRPGTRRLLLVSVTAVLLVGLVAWGAYAILGSSSAEERPAVATAEEPGAAAPAADEKPAAAPAMVPTEDAARELVASFYVAIVEKDYAVSYAALSDGYKTSTFPTRQAWAADASTLVAIRFPEGPEGLTAEISGEEAIVRGRTQAIYTNGQTEKYDGVWTLVAVDGEWKIDSINAPPESAR